MAGVAPEQTNPSLAERIDDLERTVRRHLERVGDLERRLAEARHELLVARELYREVAGDAQRQAAA